MLTRVLIMWLHDVLLLQLLLLLLLLLWPPLLLLLLLFFLQSLDVFCLSAPTNTDFESTRLNRSAKQFSAARCTGEHTSDLVLHTAVTATTGFQ